MQPESHSAGIVVSVIVPTHARRALLGRLLDSLARQTLDAEKFEVLIVHNHTADGSEELSRAWCERQRFRARYFRQNNRGPARSREFGARMATGRVLAFIDDDCVASPGWLKAGMGRFCRGGEHSSQGAPGGAAIGLAQGMTLPMPEQTPGFPSKTVHISGPTLFFETCNIFYARDAFEAVGGFSADFLDKFYGEDTDLGWKVRERGYATEFAADALVYHEVFRVSFTRWLSEALHYENIPLLVRKHAALRDHMYLRFFLTRETCLFNVALLSLLIVALGQAAGGLLALPYFVARYRSGVHVGGTPNRLARMVVGIPRSACMWWALAKGSMRARSLLL